MLLSGADDGADTIFVAWALLAAWILEHIYLTKGKKITWATAGLV